MEPHNYSVSSIPREERGFTILLAALVAALVLALGISIFSIAQKQLILSSIGRNSQYAFYAADTGAECALYWDARHLAFSNIAPLSPISCDANTDIVVSHSDLSLYPHTFTFDFDTNGYCSQISITKNTVHPRTRIRADGFSVPCADILTSSRVLQRSVELSY